MIGPCGIINIEPAGVFYIIAGQWASIIFLMAVLTIFALRR